MAHGLPDRIWTLSRIKPLIGRRLHTRTTLSAIAQTLHRHGFSPQVPARRAPERNEEAVSGRVKETWPLVETPQRRSGLRLCCEDEAGFSMTPPTNRTRARPGHTPVIRIRGRSRRRFSIAARACCRRADAHARSSGPSGTSITSKAAVAIPPGPITGTCRSPPASSSVPRLCSSGTT
ncbi:winged helix-turn-helix domain-containing protein [Streptomyces sp. NBC_01235]|uniref:winged helix-turn-helix domain-containing protein n=1 Tax=Streptomyces sp. NBC_01235 TaxID=2903788 RepID=UPI002E0DE323|nr:winged helix-turn-helix domain-containing protein [Streptomyces sp. NBC_01235]